MLSVDARNVKDLTKTAGTHADLAHLTPMEFLLTASPVLKTAINRFLRMQEMSTPNTVVDMFFPTTAKDSNLIPLKPMNALNASLASSSIKSLMSAGLVTMSKMEALKDAMSAITRKFGMEFQLFSARNARIPSSLLIINRTEFTEFLEMCVTGASG